MTQEAKKKRRYPATRRPPTKPRVGQRIGTKEIERVWRAYAKCRSVAGARRLTGHATWTITKLRDEGNWVERLERMDREVAEKQDEKMVLDRAEEIELVSRVFRKLVEDYDNAEPGSKPQIATAIANLGKHMQLIKGGATERPEVSWVEEAKEIYEEHLRTRRMAGRTRYGLERAAQGVDDE